MWPRVNRLANLKQPANMLGVGSSWAAGQKLKEQSAEDELARVKLRSTGVSADASKRRRHHAERRTKGGGDGGGHPRSA